MRDRTHYRQLIDDELIEIGRDSNHELSIALAERLEDVIALDAQLADQKETIDDMRLLISNLEDEISALVKQINEGQPK